MVVSSKTDLRFPESGQQGHGARIIQAIRGFCIGKKNWKTIDTINGATSSAIIYSIAETAKANNLKPYDYFEYLLTEIRKHEDDTNTDFLEALLPWSETLPEHNRKPIKGTEK